MFESRYSGSWPTSLTIARASASAEVQEVPTCPVSPAPSSSSAFNLPREPVRAIQGSTSTFPEGTDAGDRKDRRLSGGSGFLSWGGGPLGDSIEGGAISIARKSATGRS